MSLSNLTTSIPPAPRRMPGWLLPLGLLAGFGGLFLFILRHELLPAPMVQTARAEYAGENTGEPAAEQEKRAKLLFRATGWLGADPLPAAATTYIPGRVVEVPVVEGEAVQQGQVIARLDATEYELALAEAEGELQAAEAHAAAAEAGLAEARATLTALHERTANYALRHERYSRMTRGAASEQQRTDARQELAEYRARTEAQEHSLSAAESATAQARAMVTAAKARRDKAALDLSRCVITAPISGRIMKLNAVPGGRLSPGGETVDMSTAATIYDPQKLALAADVPLDQAGQLAVGQQVRIHCDVYPEQEFAGRVARIYGQADQTRNTIRCQVSIENAADMLRPDMQCRGAFYSEGVITADSAAEEASNTQTSGLDLVRVPREAIVGDSVWVVSPEGILRLRRIEHVGDKLRGVLPGEPVVLHPGAELKEGMRVRTSN